jgi:hypothetical protein
MPVDPLLLTAGLWLGAASGILAALMVAGFVKGWGFRFRLVGVTSFTALLRSPAWPSPSATAPASRWRER